MLEKNEEDEDEYGNCPFPDDCEKCGEELSYSVDDYSLYCEKCDEWLQPDCGDPDCYICTNRPEKPSARLQEQSLEECEKIPLKRINLTFI